ncbi:MAG: Mur ligase family protein [Candidatus Andersenbacteria bacterium]
MKKQSNNAILMIGIGGSGMRGLAHILATDTTIIGTDSAYERIKNDATLQEYELIPESAVSERLNDIGHAIYTDALPQTHPLLTLLREASIPVEPYHVAVGQISTHYTTIAVTGTHGKSSTTAFLSHILIEAGLDPTVLIGASVPAWNNRNARRGAGSAFILEADEYREHFLEYKPQHIIITTIDFDHPDYFTSLAQVKRAYEKFMEQRLAHGRVITTKSTYDSATDVAWPSDTIVIDPADYPCRVALPGTHMQHNAALAAAAAEKLCNVAKADAQRYVATFRGLGRRFEIISQTSTQTIISDYGHHPTEIAATLQAARGRYPNEKMLVLFEAHTIERLLKFAPAFQDALLNAPIDGLVICPIFYAKGRTSATETDQHFTAYHVQKKLPVYEITSYDELPALLQKLHADYSVVIGFSAGELDGVLRTIASKP